MKICGAPIDVNPCLFTWNIFQQYAHLIDRKPHWEVFRAMESQTDKEEIGKFLLKVWECVRQRPGITPYELDWIINIKYFSWVCAFDKDLGYIESIWNNVNKDLSGADSLKSCQLAEKKFYDNLLANGKNSALRTMLDELLAPCIQISQDIKSYLDADTGETKE